jgi:hypothetical protein
MEALAPFCGLLIDGDILAFCEERLLEHSTFGTITE